MTREIKFRAWDKFKKKWVNLFDDENIVCTGQSSPESELDGIAKYWLGTSGECDHVWMQSTGLEDKKGVEIYEGDIIEFEFAQSGKFNRTCEWSETKSGFVFSGFEYGPEDLKEYCKIIDNIYENKKLIN